MIFKMLELNRNFDVGSLKSEGLRPVRRIEGSEMGDDAWIYNNVDTHEFYVAVESENGRTVRLTRGINIMTGETRGYSTNSGENKDDK